MDIQITPELITAAAGFVAAIGTLIKQIRDRRRERRERKYQLERVTRAAARGPKVVAELVDEYERTGEFKRPTIADRRGRSRASRARADEADRSDT